ncbi:SDR family NAD(P)-dependent oxidoreductase [Streptomyces coeruleorubidus]|jgi:NAD(P)-dependent dehydrogenase (short-subunit alcohol dehydrogenase family)|uniref:SDR family NAD(P)-dependent oxidoreductase n=1 Tax=Streptomyces coeruleorubidus TaxID=116188 RepID=UPI00339F00F0
MSGTGFEGRSVVVTGAASGIGRAAALMFAEEGAKVLVADLDKAGADETAKVIETAGGTAVAVAGDLSDPQVVDEVVATAVRTFGSLDVLVNNAGIGDSMSALADVEDAEWERVIRVNLTAPFLLTRAALPHMLAAGHGRIVFTASEAGFRGSVSGTAYTASKHGVVGLVKSLAVMYRKQGIRTNAIAPGGTQTNILTNSLGTEPDKMTALVNTVSGQAQSDGGTAPHGPTILRDILRSNPGRRSTPEEQAAVIVFLASDAAEMINGAVLPVDDGWSAV